MEGHRSVAEMASGRRKKAQLFRCKGATSNAVNAYPMPNRHEFFDNNCPNGQFKCDILPGRNAVNRPFQAFAEILWDLAIGRNVWQFRAMASEMSYGADKTFSIDGRVDTPVMVVNVRKEFWTKSGIKGGRVSPPQVQQA
jgi:hypothetical protein